MRSILQRLLALQKVYERIGCGLGRGIVQRTGQRCPGFVGATCGEQRGDEIEPDVDAPRLAAEQTIQSGNGDGPVVVGRRRARLESCRLVAREVSGMAGDEASGAARRLGRETHLAESLLGSG